MDKLKSPFISGISSAHKYSVVQYEGICHRVRASVHHLLSLKDKFVGAVVLVQSLF